MRRVCQCFGVKMVHAEVYNIDPDTKEIFCTDGRPPIRYDIVVINIGITPKLGSPDWVNHTGVIAVKPINRFADRWTSMLDRLLALPPEEEKRLVVVGGGAGGTELAFAVHYRVTTELKARGIDAANFKVCLLTRGKTVLAEHNRCEVPK
jgi:selenide,water dikinase